MHAFSLHTLRGRTDRRTFFLVSNEDGGVALKPTCKHSVTVERLVTRLPWQILRSGHGVEHLLAYSNASQQRTL